MKRYRRPDNVPTLGYLEIIVGRQLSAAHRLGESLDHTGSVLGPGVVLKWSNIVEDNVGVFGIILRRFVGIERAPRRVVLIDQRLEFSLQSHFCGGLLRLRRSGDGHQHDQTARRYGLEQRPFHHWYSSR